MMRVRSWLAAGPDEQLVPSEHSHDLLRFRVLRALIQTAPPTSPRLPALRQELEDARSVLHAIPEDAVPEITAALFEHRRTLSNTLPEGDPT